MVESFKYGDKNIDTIKKDVETEFKSIDKRGQRDDKEIFQSGINICSKYTHIKCTIRNFMYITKFFYFLDNTTINIKN